MFGKPGMASIVLVDMLNVVNRDKWKDAPRLSINWKVLREHLEKELNGTMPLPSGKRAYYWPDKDPTIVQRWLAQAEPSWNQAGYKLFAKAKDDTDANIAGAMARLGYEAYRQGYKKLRIVIVSGDEVFANEFAELRTALRAAMQLELIVVGWPNSISRNLKSIATRVRSLASIDRLVRTQRSP